MHVKAALLCSINHTYPTVQQQHAVRGTLADASPVQAVKAGGRRVVEDIWESCWIVITPSLQTCVRDGEGAGAAGSRPDRECRPGGEITEWEEGDSGVRLRIHPSAQPAEVRNGSHLLLMTAKVSGEPRGDPLGGSHAAKLGII